MYTGILQKLEELEKRIAELEEMHSEDDDAEEDFEGTTPELSIQKMSDKTSIKPVLNVSYPCNFTTLGDFSE